MKTYSKENILEMLKEVYDLTSDDFTKINLNQIVYKKHKLSASLPIIMKRCGFIIEGDRRSSFKWGLDHPPMENDVINLYEVYKEYTRNNTKRYRERKNILANPPYNNKKDKMTIKALTKIINGLSDENEQVREAYKKVYSDVLEIVKLDSK
jgi:hypothetical protein